MLVTYTDANGNEVLVTPSNPLPTSAGGASSSATDPVKVNGTLGALNATLAISIGQRDTMSMHVLGTFVGSIVLQGSGDGTNWVSLTGATQWQNISTNANLGTITGVGLYQTTVSALPFVRVLMSAYTSGAASVYLEAVDGNAAVFLDSPLPAGANTIGAVTLAAGGNGAVRIWDGTTNTSVKAASTAAATTDTAVVVALSPNSNGVVNTPVTATPFSLNSAATTNLTQVKATAGTLYEIDCSNTSAAAVFLKLYNAPSASVVVGTTVPFFTARLSATGNPGDTAIYSFAGTGKRFSSGISYALTGAAATSDTTAIAAGVLVSGSYI